MRILGKWGMAATLVCCGLLFLACANNDNNAPNTSVLDLWQAGKTVTTETVTAYGGIDKCFAAEPIPDGVWQRMQGKTFKENPYIKTLDDGTLLIQPPPRHIATAPGISPIRLITKTSVSVSLLRLASSGAVTGLHVRTISTLNS